MKIKKLLAGTITASLALGAFAGNAALVSAGEDTTITVAASATPHAEILEQAAPLLKAEILTPTISSTFRIWMTLTKSMAPAW